VVSPISLETARDGTDANVDIMDHAIRNMCSFVSGGGSLMQKIALGRRSAPRDLLVLLCDV
jgi:hypothetical protein